MHVDTQEEWEELERITQQLCYPSFSIMLIIHEISDTVTIRTK